MLGSSQTGPFCPIDYTASPDYLMTLFPSFWPLTDFWLPDVEIASPEIVILEQFAFSFGFGVQMLDSGLE